MDVVWLISNAEVMETSALSCRLGCRGRSGRRLFQPAALPPSRASSTALGGIAADAVADGLSLGDLHSAAVAGVGAVAVLHGGPRCRD
jgi:hypothetical protein